MKRVLTFLIAIGILIGIFVVFQGAKANEKIALNENESGEKEVYIGELNLPLIEVDTFNPILTKNKQVSDTLKLIYEPLFDFNETNHLEPKLASEWYEKDEVTWIIKLNSKAKWHSGKEFTADDVIFTYQTILAEESVYKENVKNISSIEKIDTNALQIHLTRRDEKLPYQLIFPIIPRYYFEGNLRKNEIKFYAIGTGPYFYDSALDEKTVALKANYEWWQPKEFKLTTIYLYQYATYGEAIKAFKSTQIDVISTTMSSWQKKFGAIGINAYSYESLEFETIIPNTQNAILKESSVRRMILAGINSANIIETVYLGAGKASDYPVPSTSYLNFYEGDKNYDIEKAKQLLINAGWSNESGSWRKVVDGKNQKLEFDLLVNQESEEKLEIANLIMANLQEIGVKIKIVKVNSKEYQKRLQEGKFELALATLNLDMDTDVLELVGMNDTKNFARYQNQTMETLLQEVRLENLEEKFLQIQNLYKNEAPYIGMYYKCNQLLTNKSVKGDIKPTSWNIYHDIIGWCK